MSFLNSLPNYLENKYKNNNLLWEEILLLPKETIESKLKINYIDYSILKNAADCYCNISNPSSALDMFKNKNTKFSSTGCHIIDSYLGGGIPTQGITELFGEGSVGKTQIALQLALTVLFLPKFESNKKIIYIETQNGFPIRRFQQLSQVFSKRSEDKISPETLQSKILIRECRAIDELIECIQNYIPYVLQKQNVALIVIDSIAALLRPESEFIELSKKVNIIGTCLKTYSAKYNIPIVCINQVSANLEKRYENQLDIKPSLSLMWTNFVTTRILVQREHIQSKVRILRVIHSPIVKSKFNNICRFQIKQTGVEGVKYETIE